MTLPFIPSLKGGNEDSNMKVLGISDSPIKNGDVDLSIKQFRSANVSGSSGQTRMSDLPKKWNSKKLTEL